LPLVRILPRLWVTESLEFKPQCAPWPLLLLLRPLPLPLDPLAAFLVRRSARPVVEALAPFAVAEFAVYGGAASDHQASDNDGKNRQGVDIHGERPLAHPRLW
jgi:hypothetical protein